jgi:hypothetical protein
MDHILHGFSLTDYPNIKRIILRILNKMRVKFSKTYAPTTFKMKTVYDFAMQIACLFVKK